MLRRVLLLLLVALVTAVWLGPALRAIRDGGSRRRNALIGLALALALAAVSGLTAPDRQKMLTHLIMPPGLVWLGLVALFADAVHRRVRPLAWALGVVTLLYSLSGNVLLGDLGLLHLQRLAEPVDWTEGPPYEAVFVLGGGTKPNPAPARYALAAAGDRVMLGARIYKRGRVRKLICSGRGVPGLSSEDLTEATTALWTEMGIPETDILRLPNPHNTKMELAELAGLIEAHGWTRVGLLTSGYHLPRAMALAARNGLDVDPIAADQYLGPDRFLAIDVVPQRRGFARTTTVLWEHLGRLVGR